MTGNLFPARLRESHEDKRQNTNFRRNGKLQACEPCRKGKLRCDHMMPNCGRCVKRNKQDQCVYHPAPLTKGPTPQDSNSDESSPRVNNFSTAYQSPSYHNLHRDSVYPEAKRLKRTKAFAPTFSPESLLSKQTASYDRQSSEDVQKSILDHSIRTDTLGFDSSAGFIDHSAVLAEHELSIGIHSSKDVSTPIPKVSQAQIDRGAAVLSLLNDLPAFEKYIDKWFSFAGGIVVIEPMVKMYLDGLCKTWHKTLGSQNPLDLSLMSEKIWENTLRPVSRFLNRHTTPREFCANVTGPFLRWEVVGILVSLVSLVAQSLKDGDPMFCSHDNAPVDRAALALKTHNASEMCVQFCDDFGVINDLYLWLLYENATVYCSMRSRGSYENSRKTASLSNALLSFNLHQEIRVDDHTPFFMAQLRKRLFICAYDNDKYTAAFSGQPPRLTRHYCRLQIPLDLTDAQTMSDGPELEEAVEDLDDYGWNQQGLVQRSTYARLAASNALITEEILEISLGSLPQHEILQRAEDIELRTNRFWEQLPEFLRIDVTNPWSSQRSPLELLFLAFNRLNHLDHLFMLQRTISKKVNNAANDPSAKLLSVSSEIFNFVVSMVDNKDNFRDFQIDFAQILVKYGIPTAAALAVELLHQERHPASASAIAYPLHRSDTIQSLSVFVACLGTIKPDASGYQSCVRGRTFIKKILDMILGSGPATPNSPQVTESTNDPMLSAPLLQPGSDGDFVRWLDDMDWDQDSWINFN
ncbi:hypothetical protein HBH56_003700 [Parastagonospora nodorum]|uniref:Zn(2)-C6 fungal-type domain-containing protein n=2 Tax=Phaeosphaeria nodorum (strain SN15 / ATCC MYA-4574 / FGSC 10173) TaxID=321614 RepID=A0A7U2EQU4_PHANO|nr:hypothetical protein HBH56_003700 [Parastagonospora nodorum]QRC90288.1 hypothetical protein JI435_306750 [Parastagonospora nodorum SN15]KAH3937692.1 hypothetical protein HBH54_003690 [Parastagonospora nodorum]KAH3975035.1 hypothetical protein HBH51_086460 [Parastagonospora nodorum]KAH3978354.1 hypothetical protein HBH52_106350 [Parastagonospora nodorum]